MSHPIPGVRAAIGASPRVIALSRASAATLAWILAREAADGAQHEPAVISAIVPFANWRIPLGGACCLMAGARTLEGALVPMVGTAFTGVNLVSGDYNRLGIQLNISTKSINTNAGVASRAQDDRHVAAWVATDYTVETSSNRHPFGGNAANVSDAVRILTSGAYQNRCVNAGSVAVGHSNWSTVDKLFKAGLCGVARNNSSTYEAVLGSVIDVVSQTSGTPAAEAFYFGANSGGANGTNARLSMGSVGAYISMETMAARMAAAYAGIAAAVS